MSRNVFDNDPEAEKAKAVHFAARVLAEHDSDRVGFCNGHAKHCCPDPTCNTHEFDNRYEHMAEKLLERL